MNRNQGFTMVELLVAMVLIAVGVSAAVGLQVTALRSNAQAREINDVTRFVKNELEWQRNTTIEFDEVVIEDCASPRGTLPDGFDSCVVVVEPCVIDFAAEPNTLVCGPTASAAAFRVTVAVEGARGKAFSLSSLNTGVFISGAVSEVLE